VHGAVFRDTPETGLPLAGLERPTSNRGKSRRKVRGRKGGWVKDKAGRRWKGLLLREGMGGQGKEGRGEKGEKR